MKQIFFFALAALWWSCTDTPPTRTRTADCYVRYLKPESQTLAETILREGTVGQSDLKSTSSVDGVRYLGVLMRDLNLKGTTTYRLEQSGGYNPEHTFVWKDDENHPYTFRMNLPPISAFSFDPEVLSRQKTATLTWQGAPLDKDERIAMIWETTDRSRTVPMEIIGSPGQNSIEFPAAQLSKLDPGTWTLYLVRKKSVQENIHGTAVLGIAEYYTDVDTVLVQD